MRLAAFSFSRPQKPDRGQHYVPYCSEQVFHTIATRTAGNSKTSRSSLPEIHSLHATVLVV